MLTRPELLRRLLAAGIGLALVGFFIFHRLFRDPPGPIPAGDASQTGASPREPEIVAPASPDMIPAEDNLPENALPLSVLSPDADAVLRDLAAADTFESPFLDSFPDLPPPPAVEDSLPLETEEEGNPPDENPDIHSPDPSVETSTPLESSAPFSDVLPSPALTEEAREFLPDENIPEDEPEMPDDSPAQDSRRDSPSLSLPPASENVSSSLTPPYHEVLAVADSAFPDFVLPPEGESAPESRPVPLDEPQHVPTADAPPQSKVAPLVSADTDAVVAPRGKKNPGRPLEWAVPLELEGVPNLARVSPTLYRGAQPSRLGVENLHAMGIKTILSFRQFNSDRELIGELPLRYERLDFNAFYVDRKELLRFLQVVTDPEYQPVFIHCWHGVDRTGVMAAVYRIVVQGWSREAAIREFVDGFDMHEKVYRNLVRFLRREDFESLARRAGLPPPAAAVDPKNDAD